MTPAPTPPDELVGAAKGVKLIGTLQSLTNAAQNLNELTDRLTAQVGEIETTINKLNLGVSTTVEVESSSDPALLTTYVVRIGYGKVGGKWGFIIDDFIDEDSENTYQMWAFKDAPRDLRLKVVERIPRLLEALVTTSIKLASDINGKIDLTKELVSVLCQTSPAAKK
jgi:hypothetical protein